MALRLILVGVVASLALDLPPGGSRPLAKPIQSRLIAESSRPVYDADQWKLFENDFIPRKTISLVPTTTSEAVVSNEAVEPKVATPAESVATKEVVETKVSTEPWLPILPGRAEAEAVTALENAAIAEAMRAAAADVVSVGAEKAAVAVAEADPIPVMPPAPEIAAAPEVAPLPVPEAAPAPIVTADSVNPMAPPGAPVEVVAPEQAPAPPPVVAETPDASVAVDADAVFNRVMNKMVAVFAIDLPAQSPVVEPKALVAEVEKPVAPPAAAAEELDAVDLYPGIAFVLNREAEGLAPIAMPLEPKIEPATELAAAPEPATAPIVESTTEPDPAPSRAERLANAVKLTGEAVHAWAGLLSQRPSVSAMQR